MPETVFYLSLNRLTDWWADKVATGDGNQNKKQNSNKQLMTEVLKTNKESVVAARRMRLPGIGNMHNERHEEIKTVLGWEKAQ